MNLEKRFRELRLKFTKYELEDKEVIRIIKMGNDAMDRIDETFKYLKTMGTGRKVDKTTKKSPYEGDMSVLQESMKLMVARKKEMQMFRDEFECFRGQKMDLIDPYVLFDEGVLNVTCVNEYRNAIPTHVYNVFKELKPNIYTKDAYWIISYKEGTVEQILGKGKSPYETIFSFMDWYEIVNKKDNNEQTKENI